jgi:plastocyanin
VTWTNNDTVPHTATATEGAFQSGKISAGESFSVALEEAGTFEYFCEYHTGMKATITVS